MITLILSILFLFQTASGAHIKHPNQKNLHAHLEEVCGKFVNINGVCIKLKKHIKNTLKEKQLTRIKDQEPSAYDVTFYVLYTYKKDNRLQAVSITYDAEHDAFKCQKTTPSSSIRKVFKAYAEQYGHFPAPLDHTGRNLQKLWSTFKHIKNLNLLASEALGSTLMSEKKKATLNAQAALALMQGSLWNHMSESTGLWCMDGYMFHINVPASYKTKPGVLSISFKLVLKSSGLYTVDIVGTPQWKGSE